MFLIDKNILILISRFLNNNEEIKKIVYTYPAIHKDFWKYKCIDKFNSIFFENIDVNVSKFIIDNKFDSKNYFDSMIEMPSKIYFPSLVNYNIINIDKNIFYFKGNFKNGNRALRGNIPYPLFEKPFSSFCILNNKFKLLPNFIYYYEICILEENEHINDNSCISIGFCNIKFPLIGRQVGWDSYSYGLHSDDGKLFHNNISNDFTSSFGGGDYIGCGLYFNGENYDIFYTKNGKFLGYAFKNIEKQIFFPVIGIDCKNKIKINFGNVKFKFNIIKMQKLANENYKIINNLKKINLKESTNSTSLNILNNFKKNYQIIDIYLKENMDLFISMNENNKENMLLNIIEYLNISVFNDPQNILNIPLTNFLHNIIPLNIDLYEEESITQDSEDDMDNYSEMNNYLEMNYP